MESDIKTGEFDEDIDEEYEKTRKIKKRNGIIIAVILFHVSSTIYLLLLENIT